MIKRRFWIHVSSLSLVYVLIGCGGGSGGGGAASTTAPSSTVSSLGDEVAALERAGRLPTLDRTTSLLGTDSDRNGVRDDIDAYVAALTLSEVKKKAILQTARALQRSLAVDLSDRVELLRVAEEIMAAANCSGDVLSFAERNEFDVEPLTANTRERVTQYLRFNAALSGTSTALPVGDTCTP